MTTAQIIALESAGAEIARSYLDVATDTPPDPDYNFSGNGDWTYIREQAIAAGIEWDADDIQPADQLTVWAAVGRGYKAALNV